MPVFLGLLGGYAIYLVMTGTATSVAVTGRYLVQAVDSLLDRQYGDALCDVGMAVAGPLVHTYDQELELVREARDVIKKAANKLRNTDLRGLRKRPDAEEVLRAVQTVVAGNGAN